MFYHVLALRLGRSVEELLATLSSRALTYWMAFDSISPIGDWRNDLAAGQIAAVVAETHRDRKARAKPFTPRDFMPFVEREPEAVEVSRDVLAALGPLIAKRKKGKGK